jgi:transcription termination factor Rho
MNPLLLLQFESEGRCSAEVSSQVEAVNEESVNESSSEKKVSKIIKFNKSAYEKKIALKG